MQQAWRHGEFSVVNVSNKEGERERGEKEGKEAKRDKVKEKKWEVIQYKKII
jgi:hypothetical protein